MGRYKPEWGVGTEIIGRRLAHALNKEELALDRARGRVLAAAVRAPGPFPDARRAGMDGVAVVEGVVRFQVQTGAPVDDTVEYVVMDELGHKPGDVVARPEGARHVTERGAEYRSGELVAPRGTVVDGALASQLALLHVERVTVFERPQIVVAVVGKEAESAAVHRWLSWTFEERFPFAVSTHFVSRVEEVPSALVGSCHLLVVASDGAPGRYGRLRSLHRESPSWYRSDFWKLDVHPCKHIGFGRVGDVPTLVLPDVLFKTAISTALVGATICEGLFNLPPVMRRPLKLEAIPTLPGPYPYVWPVRRGEGPGEWFVLPVEHGFSGRGAVGLDGLAWWSNEGATPELLPFGWEGTYGRRA